MVDQSLIAGELIPWLERTNDPWLEAWLAAQEEDGVGPRGTEVDSG